MLVYQRVSKTTKTKMWVPLSSTILPLPGQEGLPRVVFFGYPKLSWVQHGSPKLRSELDLGDPYDLGSPKKNLGLWIFFSSSSVLLYSFIFFCLEPLLQDFRNPKFRSLAEARFMTPGWAFLVRFNFLNLIGRENSEKLPCATFFSISVALQQTNIAIEKRTIYR